MAPEINNTPSVADPLGLVVAITRVEVKVEGITTDVQELKLDVRDLKERRWPLTAVALLLSLVGTGTAVIALVQQH